eukprot:CAMPEP_0184706716 /NCGR_PEP_ID=MMETSP0313-20130426/36900_1 /TAXON_ID=2792 /ORGANISM="Porphyridium aerugineum, Strain SAG 1380-2" /LENGTH=289 /DNA_ID=CAMNT_0027168277 /DNA_START=763 /DNA_END=1632 /DNA_ORIENTATION=-
MEPSNMNDSSAPPSSFLSTDQLDSTLKHHHHKHHHSHDTPAEFFGLGIEASATGTSNKHDRSDSAKAGIPESKRLSSSPLAHQQEHQQYQQHQHQVIPNFRFDADTDAAVRTNDSGMGLRESVGLAPSADEEGDFDDIKQIHEQARMQMAPGDRQESEKRRGSKQFDANRVERKGSIDGAVIKSSHGRDLGELRHIGSQQQEHFHPKLAGAPRTLHSALHSKTTSRDDTAAATAAEGSDNENRADRLSKGVSFNNEVHVAVIFKDGAREEYVDVLEKKLSSQEAIDALF